MSTPTSPWTPTGAWLRSVVLTVVGLGLAVLLAEPVVLVLLAPISVQAVLGWWLRPRGEVRLGTGVDDHGALLEGQAMRSHLRVQGPGADDVESVTRVVPPTRHIRVSPDAGARVCAVGEDLDVVIGVRRWGVHEIPAEQVQATSAWAGFRAGPVAQAERTVRALPAPAEYGSEVEAPRPDGLVGRHRGARPGSGTDLIGVRPFVSGDRLRRINWRVSARTGDLHVTTTRAEQDAGLVLVLDLTAEHGHSGGIDGAASSLDVTVRAAAALAEHAVRGGDRVALRPIGGRARAVQPGSGRRHLHRVWGALGSVRPEALRSDAVRHDLGLDAGATVVVLSPLFSDAVATVVADLTRRGVPTIVIDPLPDLSGIDVAPPESDAALADLAWRMRLLERRSTITRLRALGCPVVAWKGPRTVDELLVRLAHRPVRGRA